MFLTPHGERMIAGGTPFTRKVSLPSSEVVYSEVTSFLILIFEPWTWRLESSPVLPGLAYATPHRRQLHFEERLLLCTSDDASTKGKLGGLRLYFCKES